MRKNKNLIKPRAQAHGTIQLWDSSRAYAQGRIPHQKTTHPWASLWSFGAWIKILIAVCVVTLLCIFAKPMNAADTIMATISWDPQSYAPFDYLLRARLLPIQGTTIRLYTNIFSVRQTSSGKTIYTPLDPKQYAYEWYTNGIKIQQGNGLSDISFQLKQFVKTNSLMVAVRINDPNTNLLVGQSQVSIPVLDKPDATIHQIQNNKILPVAINFIQGTAEQKITVFAKAYGLNVQSINNINFLWYHKSEQIPLSESDPQILELTLPKNPTRDRFSFIAQNGQRKLEYIEVFFTVSNK